MDQLGFHGGAGEKAASTPLIQILHTGTAVPRFPVFRTLSAVPDTGTGGLQGSGPGACHKCRDRGADS
jgi:hypothetical protein